MTYTDWILTVFLTVYVVFHWFGNPPDKGSD